jgi:hypothetical protein
MVMMCLGIPGNRWVSLDVHFVWLLEQLGVVGSWLMRLETDGDDVFGHSSTFGRVGVL